LEKAAYPCLSRLDTEDLELNNSYYHGVMDSVVVELCPGPDHRPTSHHNYMLTPMLVKVNSRTWRWLREGLRPSRTTLAVSQGLIGDDLRMLLHFHLWGIREGKKRVREELGRKPILASLTYMPTKASMMSWK